MSRLPASVVRRLVFLRAKLIVFTLNFTVKQLKSLFPFFPLLLASVVDSSDLLAGRANSIIVLGALPRNLHYTLALLWSPLARCHPARRFFVRFDRILRRVMRTFVRVRRKRGRIKGTEN